MAICVYCRCNKTNTEKKEGIDMSKKLLIITTLTLLICGCSYENTSVEIINVSKDIFFNYLDYKNGSGEIIFTIENTGFAAITKITINFVITGNDFTLQKTVNVPMFLQHNESIQIPVFFNEVIDTVYKVTVRFITIETNWDKSNQIVYKKEFNI